MQEYNNQKYNIEHAYKQSQSEIEIQQQDKFYIIKQGINLTIAQMDITQVFSSQSQENHGGSFSQQNHHTISTDIQQRSSKHTKTKNIKKKYEAIQQSGKIYHYEDDPQEYKRIRKKIQNRLSARRVRGRKETAFDSLEHEVQYLRNKNSHLQLHNARLETQNKSLREQIEFMRGLIKPQHLNLKPDPIENFLSPQTLTQTAGSSDFESPFMQDESDWLRLPNRRSSSNSWTMLAVFTLVLAIFVIPSQTVTNSPTVLFSTTTENNQVSKSWGQMLLLLVQIIMDFVKVGFKYLLIFGYIWVVYTFCHNIYKRKKLKKV